MSMLLFDQQQTKGLRANPEGLQWIRVLWGLVLSFFPIIYTNCSSISVISSRRFYIYLLHRLHIYTKPDVPYLGASSGVPQLSPAHRLW